MYEEFAHTAEKLGLSIAPPKKPYMGAKVTLEGKVNDILVRTDGSLLSGSRSHWAWILPQGDGGLYVRRKTPGSLWQWLKRRFEGTHVVPTSIDRCVELVACDEEIRAQQLLVQMHKAFQKLGANPFLDFEIFDSGVRLSPSDTGAFSEEFEKELRLLSRIARALNHAYEVAPQASLLVPHHDAWPKWAESLGFQLTDRPLGLTGKWRTYSMVVTTERKAKNQFALQLTVRRHELVEQTFSIVQPTQVHELPHEEAFLSHWFSAIQANETRLTEARKHALYCVCSSILRGNQTLQVTDEQLSLTRILPSSPEEVRQLIVTVLDVWNQLLQNVTGSPYRLA